MADGMIHVGEPRPAAGAPTEAKVGPTTLAHEPMHLLLEMAATIERSHLFGHRNALEALRVSNFRFNEGEPAGWKDPPVAMSDNNVTRDELAARLETIEARAETRFAELLGEIRTSNAELSGKIEAASSKALDKWTAVGLGIALVALLYAMLAYGGTLFGLGISAKSIADEAARAAVAAAQK